MNEPFAQNQIYHIFNRGCNKQNIFFSERNYLYLLRKIKESYREYGVGNLAYCLMPNHYHFLLRQETERPLSDWLQRLFNGYVQALNKELDRSGTLFQGRPKHVLIETDEQLVHVVRYIHINPVKAGLAGQPEDWRYSNYLEWIEARSGTLVDREFIGSYFAAVADYREFVSSYLEENFGESKYRELYLDV